MRKAGHGHLDSQPRWGLRVHGEAAVVRVHDQVEGPSATAEAIVSRDLLTRLGRTDEVRALAASFA
jgi:hypothetical protein